MSIQEITCGQLGSTDCASIARSGRYLAVVGAPSSTLQVLPLHRRAKVRAPRLRDVSAVLLRFCGEDTELLFSQRRSGAIERHLIEERRRQHTLAMPVGYDLTALTDTADGSIVAAGDSFGHVRVWDLTEEEPRQLYYGRPVESSIYALAIGHNRSLFIASGCGRQWKLDLQSCSMEALHSGTRWQCFTVAAHAAHGGVAMAGDGNRIWLVDMPFRLEPSEGDTAADGFPMDEWQLDMSGCAERWSLRNRIYLPAAGPDRCSYIDSNAGANIVRLFMTAARELVVVGDHGLEVWGLSPLRLLFARGHKPSPSPRVFAATRCGDNILLAQEK